MSPPSAHDLVVGLKTTLSACGVDYEKTIRDFGQVAASEERAGGKVFTLREHVRGLLLSQLSNQRPWGPIAKNRETIGRIFSDYDPDVLQEADTRSLTNQILEIRCGNRSLEKQMRALSANIDTFRRIEKDYGSLDAFVMSSDSDAVSRRISDPGPYKLKQVGPALAREYLKNIGVRAAKPDVHIRRILGGHRLAYFPGEPSEQEAANRIAELATAAGYNTTFLDNLVWLFCAIDYGDVCGAHPRCSICALRPSCQYPKRTGT